MNISENAPENIPNFTPDPTLYPFDSRWFDSSRGRMHYIDEGPSGGGEATILFCHGNPTWSFLYRDVVAALRGRFRCVAVDMLGFGLSERPAVFGYTAAEQAGVIGELVDHLDLDGYVSMGQDWGGPMSLAVATERADRVRGVVLGNTWFWPATASITAFSLLMSSPPMQYAILRHNFFVKAAMTGGVTHRLSPAVRRHYLDVQPTPAARVGIARLPKELRAARPLMQRLADEVPAKLGAKPTLLLWGMKDATFRPHPFLNRIRSSFSDHVLVKLPHAGHYIQEDAPAEIAAAITERFG